MILTISLLYLRGVYHGRGEIGVEYPPDEHRVVMALTGAAGDLHRGTGVDYTAVLRWLETLEPPDVYAPPEFVGTTIPRYVPSNDAPPTTVGTILRRGEGPATGAWPHPLDHVKDQKLATTVHIPNDVPLQYRWMIAKAPDSEIMDHLRALARVVVTVGGGEDFVSMTVQLTPVAEVASLANPKAERWVPWAYADKHMRVSVVGTNAALEARYQGKCAQFVDVQQGRTSVTTLQPAPLTEWRSVGYVLDTIHQPPPWHAVNFRTLDNERGIAYDLAAGGLTCAGRLRCAAQAAAKDLKWDDATIANTVMGHGPGPNGWREGAGVALVPVPSIRPNGHGYVIDASRRGFLVAMGSDRCGSIPDRERVEVQLRDLHRGIHNQPARDQDQGGRPVGIHKAVSAHDGNLMPYVNAAQVWVSVSPVVLPHRIDVWGFSQRLRENPTADEQRRMALALEERTDHLIRTALIHSGVPLGLVQAVKLDWSKAGFAPGIPHVKGYGVPDYDKTKDRLHIRAVWPTPQRGPFVVGGGRFYGSGLLVGLDEKWPDLAKAGLAAAGVP